MIFPTIQFAIFFVVVLTTSWLLKPYPRRWKLFMLSASYFFYGSWDWRFLGLLAFTTVVDHTVGGAIHRTEDPEATAPADPRRDRQPQRRRLLQVLRLLRQLP